MPQARSLLIPILSFALLAGCETVPVDGGGAQTADPTEIRARGLAASGQHEEAAQTYLALAAKAGANEAKSLKLAATRAYLDAERVKAAQDLLAEIDADGLGEADALLRNILIARIALLQGQEQRALDLLPDKTAESIPADLRIANVEARAAALKGLRRPIDAARERVALDWLLTETAVIEANRRELWTLLQSTDLQTLSAHTPAPPDAFSGWVELALLARRAGPQLATALGGWRERYPGHPGSNIAESDLAGDAAAYRFTAIDKPTHVALLLPLEGRFGSAAAAIREGFLGAWNEDLENPARPTVTVRNTADVDLWSVYNEVLQGGADFVVGPLDKPSVSALYNTSELPLPTLALNSNTPGEDGIAPPAPAGLYEFSLSPEDEAGSVAARASLDGHQRAAMLTPETPWGERVSAAFASAWGAQGGIVVAHQIYSVQARDMSEPVRALLNIAPSEERWRALRTELSRKLEFQPRRRQDADFIFMAAFPRHARQLRPQLMFNQALNLPVYATSHVYGGTTNKAEDRDIEGVRFGDMPAVLQEDVSRGASRDATGGNLTRKRATNVRLHAFGSDAYALSSELGRLGSGELEYLEGKTGRLALDPFGHIRRELVWAEFRDGIPQLVGGQISDGNSLEADSPDAEPTGVPDTVAPSQ